MTGDIKITPAKELPNCCTALRQPRPPLEMPPRVEASVDQGIVSLAIGYHFRDS